MKYKFIVFVGMIILLLGCANSIDLTIAKYRAKADKINIGDTKEKVTGLLDPTQVDLEPGERKYSEKYINGNTLVEIYYYRSLRQADGITTDDEFTPYVFNDNKLVAIGWQSLGGPKTKGQATDDTTIYVRPQTVIVR